MYEDISRELNRDYRRIDAMMRDKGVYTEETTGKQYFTVMPTKRFTTGTSISNRSCSCTSAGIQP